jgi:hypothetical protein
MIRTHGYLNSCIWTIGDFCVWESLGATIGGTLLLVIVLNSHIIGGAILSLIIRLYINNKVKENALYQPSHLLTHIINHPLIYGFIILWTLITGLYYYLDANLGH